MRLCVCVCLLVWHCLCHYNNIILYLVTGNIFGTYMYHGHTLYHFGCSTLYFFSLSFFYSFKKWENTLFHTQWWELNNFCGFKNIRQKHNNDYVAQIVYESYNHNMGDEQHQNESNESEVFILMTYKYNNLYLYMYMYTVHIQCVVGLFHSFPIAYNIDFIGSLFWLLFILKRATCVARGPHCCSFYNFILQHIFNVSLPWMNNNSNNNSSNNTSKTILRCLFERLRFHSNCLFTKSFESKGAWN